MTKCYLDSNLLIYWKAGGETDQKLAIDKLSYLRKNEVEIFISPLVIDEFIHAIIVKARKYNQKTAFAVTLDSLNDLLKLPWLAIINPPTDFDNQRKIVSLMGDFNLGPRDAYHLLIMQANNIEGFATFDTDFKKVFAAKVLTKA